jgi:hypothetical protein
VQLYIQLALATAARPGAILDPRWAGVDFVARLARLDPFGRPRTAKHRHAAPLPEGLVPVLEALKGTGRTGYVAEYGGCAVDPVRRALRGAAGRLPGWRLDALRAAPHGRDLDGAGRRAPGGCRRPPRPRRQPHGRAAPRPPPPRLPSEGRGVGAAGLARAGRRADRAADRGFTPAGGLKDEAVKPLTDMVGATGIEPVTPTMST